jgi:hypothetical protein
VKRRWSRIGFERLRHSAESRECRARRLSRRHALPDVVVDGFGDVRLDLGLQLTVTAGSAEESAQPRQEGAQRAHERSLAMSKKRATMPVACCQACSSSRSRLRPVLVST